MPKRAWLVLGAGMFVLAGCGRPEGGAALRPDDRTDPALTSALDDPILVDPTLSQSSNLTAVRTTETPGDAFHPPGQTPVRPGPCDGALAHDPAWARELPAPFGPPAGARLRDAAGKAAAGCVVRVADFLVAQRPAALLDWYWQRAVQAGYSATQLGRGGEQVLFGARDGTSYVVVARQARSGSELGLVVRSGS